MLGCSVYKQNLDHKLVHMTYSQDDNKIFFVVLRHNNFLRG